MKLKKVDRNKVEEGVVEQSDSTNKSTWLNTINGYPVMITPYNFKKIVDRNGTLLLEDVWPEQVLLPPTGTKVQYVRHKKSSGKVQWWAVSERLSELAGRKWESTLKKVGVSLQVPPPELDPEETKTIVDYGVSIGLSRYQTKLILRDFLNEQKVKVQHLESDS